MNTNAQKWVAALRSGEYAQTRGFLHDSNGYCCLGVACDLYQKEVGGLLVRVESVAVGHGDKLVGEHATYYDGQHGVLPVAVRDWLGLINATGDHCVAGGRSLASMNDSGDDFRTIADFIESEPKGLFTGEDR
jgi:hypothetical protein